MNISQEILVLDFGDDDAKFSPQNRQTATLPANFPANSNLPFLFNIYLLRLKRFDKFKRYLLGSRRDCDHLQQRVHLPDQNVGAGLGRHVRPSPTDVHLHRVLLPHAPLDRWIQ